MTDNLAAGVPQVFVNCLFGDGYEELRDTLVPSCVACGLFPSIATV